MKSTGFRAQFLYLFNQIQLESLKLNIISSLVKNKWSELNRTLSDVAEKDSLDKVAVSAKEALILLKN